MDTKNVKIVVFVPRSHVDVVCDALGQAGAGKIGNYTNCTFLTEGVGRFRPGVGSKPYIGEVGKLEEIVEIKIETVCPRSRVDDVVTAIKKVHPYEEVALDVFPLEIV